ncbi:hypothetical protein N9985_00515 [Gammaproteobacteria bacterium]|nr:hypothetical protein [Gammaproteobacteria bacterium]
MSNNYQAESWPINKEEILMRLFISIFTFCLMASTASHAAPNEWTFDSTLRFSDGSQLSGSFLYDADTNRTDTSNLTFRCDRVCSGLTLGANSGQLENFDDGAEFFLSGFDLNGDRIEIYINLNGTLTNAGGTVSLNFGGPIPIQVENRDNDARADGINQGNTISADPVAVPVEELIANLINDVIALNLQHGISNALDAKLDSALEALELSDNEVEALNSMYAICNSVEAQRDKKIPSQDADAILTDVNTIISQLDEFAPLCEVQTLID